MEAVKTESAEEEEEEDLRITNQRWSTGAIGIPLRREMMKTGRRGETRWGRNISQLQAKTKWLLTQNDGTVRCLPILVKALANSVPPGSVQG